MASGFVSESQLDEERLRRQAEWEKVRQPDDPAAAPEPEMCNKSLYEQLKEVRDKKQLEIDESKKFKNMIRGVDEDESEFLAMVDQKKLEEQRRRRQEEREMLASMANAVTPASEPSLSLLKPPAPSKSGPNKQARLLSAAIKRKSEGGDGPPEKVSCVDAQSTSTGAKLSASTNIPRTVAPKQVGATLLLGQIPGLVAYDGSSDSDSSRSDSDADELEHRGDVPSKSTTENVTEASAGEGEAE